MAKALSRVLIADDHDLVRLGLRGLLETQPGFQIVAEVSTGRAALQAARDTKPDIAILDYSLPGLNGLDVTIALGREMPQTQVLIYTMHDRDDLVFDVLRAGARGFVLKSEAEGHLLRALEALSCQRPYFSELVSDTLLEGILAVAPPPKVLSQREREVVQLIAEGKMNKEIAHLLDIGIKTVETHRASAMHKLELQSVADLVRYAVRQTIIVA